MGGERISSSIELTGGSHDPTASAGSCNVLLMVIPFAPAAHAIPPTSEIIQADPRPYYNDELCGPNQRIWFVDSGSFKYTVFYDNAGNPVRALSTNYRERYTVTASANGKTVTTNAPAVVIEDLTAGTELVLGLLNAYHFPASAWSCSMPGAS